MRRCPGPRPRGPAIRSTITAVRSAVLVSTLTTALLGLPAPNAMAVAGTADLTASDGLVTVGDGVNLSVSVSAGGPCQAGRDLLLEWRPSDSSAFATVGQGTTGQDGTTTFTQAQQHTGRYRVTAPADGSCEAIVSNTALVRVRVLVDATLLVGSLTAPACVDVTATVAPAKPGQQVELQRRQAGVWTTIETLTLDATSWAAARPCFGWQDVGVVRLRVRWIAQDELNETAAGSMPPFGLEPAAWMERIDELIGGRSVSVSVGEAGAFLYGHAPAASRTPASNEKLLLSMAILDELGPSFRIRTRAAAERSPSDGVLRGDLWILGRGDPEVDGDTMAELARAIADAGVTRITGRVLGSTTFFRRDWDAPGWNDVARDYVARPTALSFEGNLDGRGRNLRHPETVAAGALTEALEAIGVRVKGRPGSGRAPAGLTEIAAVRSRSMKALLAKLLRPSDNFYAEVLGKRLAAETAGAPGTIAKGAGAVEAWVRDAGVSFTLFDCSGLSYDNVVTAEGIVRLLWAAETAPWGADLFDTLPTGGQGTLRHRLSTVEIRAKTGTLTSISALSGWLHLERSDAWAEFSILSQGMTKASASDLEDRIARIIQNHAR